MRTNHVGYREDPLKIALEPGLERDIQLEPERDWASIPFHSIPLMQRFGVTAC